MQFDKVINKQLAIELLHKLGEVDVSGPNERERTIATVAWVLAYTVVSATPSNETSERVIDYALKYVKDNVPIIRKYLESATTIN